jgi:VanZ family protein
MAFGWLGVCAVVWYSLIPDPPQLDMKQGDKLQHLIAYGGLMGWFSQIRLGIGERRLTAALLVLMGVTLEFAQAFTGYRYLAADDMLANTAGVALGWLLSPPRVPDLPRRLTTIRRR